MEQKLEADQYATPEDFIRDANLIFKNCKKYNNETTTYYKNAVKLEKFLNNKLREIPEYSVSCPLVLSPYRCENLTPKFTAPCQLVYRKDRWAQDAHITDPD